MKYETLLKGLMARREKCVEAGDKASWYHEEKTKLLAALEQLEERHKKSALSNKIEVEKLNEMIETVRKLMNAGEASTVESPAAGEAECARRASVDDSASRELPPSPAMQAKVAEENVAASESFITNSDLQGTKADNREPPPAFLKRNASAGVSAHG